MLVRRIEVETWADWAVEYMRTRSVEDQLSLLQNYSPEKVTGLIEKYPGIRKNLDAFLDLLHDHPAPDGLKTALFFAFQFTTQAKVTPQGEGDETADNRSPGVKLG